MQQLISAICTRVAKEFMSKRLIQLASLTSLVTLPVCVVQGLQLRRKIPQLPEATGERSGVIVGDGKPFTLLILGESTAAGVGVETIKESLGFVVAERLAHELNRPIHYHIVARSGIRAVEATEELVPLLTGIQFDLIVIALGGNDALQFRRADQWGRDLSEMIAAIWATANRAPVLLSGTPPFQQFPSLPIPLRQVLTLRGKVLDGISADVASALGDVTFLPLTDFRKAGSFSSDGFHPGVNGYRRWAEMVVASYKQSSSKELFP